MKHRLHEPGLNCPNCHFIYVKNGKKPACLFNRCDIVDIAPSKKLNDLVNAFLQVEMLDLSHGYAPFQEKILRESGLMDESSDTILEMKSVLAEYREWKSKSRGNITKTGPPSIKGVKDK